LNGSFINYEKANIRVKGNDDDVDTACFDNISCGMILVDDNDEILLMILLKS
jgi:hypothetical protein